MNTEDSAPLSLIAVPPGARLAAAVLDGEGQVLLAAGSILTEATLKNLAQLGVVAVAVERQRDAAELDKARAALRQRLKHLFRKCGIENDGSGAQMLFRAVLDHRLDTLR